MHKTTITIKGANFPNLLDELKKTNLKLNNIKKLSSCELELTVKAKHKPKIIAILNDKCYTIISQKDSQQKQFLKPLRNISIIVGIIFGFLLNVFATFFIWNIKLVGDESLKQEIFSSLKNCGIKKGTLKHNLSFAKIKKAIYEGSNNISLVSSSIKGTTLFISYTKRTPPILEFCENENIIAKNDGMIASIIATSGTPMVKLGDYVKKGQVLVSSVQKEDGTQEKARGQVFAYVWKSATVQYPLNTILWARTNNFCTNHKVMFQNSVLFETNNSCSFEKSEIETRTTYLTNKVLPIKIVYTTEFELSAIETTQNFDENKEKVISEARMLCWEQIDGDERILEEKTEINFVSNIYFVTHYIKIKEQISWN